MKNPGKFISPRFLLSLFIMVFLAGCSDPEFDAAGKALERSRIAVTELQSLLLVSEANYKASGSSAEITNVRLPNIKYLRLYAAYIRKTQPDMTLLVSTLEKEATVEGGRFQYLNARYQDVLAKYPKQAEQSRQVSIAITSEARAIALAAGYTVFNDGLVDVVNVLADMSRGKLPKLGFSETTNKEMPPTQHLVGNPSYGRWQSNSSGGSFWAWYGQYRLFSDVLGWNSGYRYNQNRWYSSRSPSYYGDVGRHYYGSNSSNKSWGQIAKRNPNVKANRAPANKIKNFKSTSRLSNYAPRTSTAPKSIPKTSRTSSYSNTRSSPSRSGGYGSRSYGK